MLWAYIISVVSILPLDFVLLSTCSISHLQTVVWFFSGDWNQLKHHCDIKDFSFPGSLQPFILRTENVGYYICS